MLSVYWVFVVVWLCGLWSVGVSLVAVHGPSHPVAGGILVPQPGVYPYIGGMES